MHDLKRFALVLSFGAIAAMLAGCNGATPAQSSTSTAPSSTPSPSPAPAPSPSPAPASNSDLTVTSPANGASVSSPFAVTASSTTCSSQTVATMAYSLDSGADTVISGTSINAQLTAAAGAHTLHVKAWGNSGAECDASLSLSVTAPSGPSLPSNAVSVTAIQALTSWQATHDPGTGGTSSGTMQVLSSPSLSGQARQFDTSFTGSGGELYHVTFGSDPNATNFLYDAQIYLTASTSSIANLEIDMNQVIANGDTVIYGFQCDGYSGTWDYTKNAGSPSSPDDVWVHSSAPCNMRKWTQNTWHHIQVTYSRDASGNVTYHSVWLDGVENPINATVPSAFSLGWASVLLTNFQIDGLGSGSDSTYIDELTISRW